MELDIKITGSGTKTAILFALEALILSIKDEDNLDGLTFEDETLCTTINTAL
jgi:hypothetical protein